MICFFIISISIIYVGIRQSKQHYSDYKIDYKITYCCCCCCMYIAFIGKC